MKTNSSHSGPSKRVSFEDTVSILQDEGMVHVDEEENQSEEPCEETVLSHHYPQKLSSDLSHEEVSSDLVEKEHEEPVPKKSICRFCGMRTKRLAELKYFDVPKNVPKAAQGRSKDLKYNKPEDLLYWPPGLNNHSSRPASYPKIIIQGYNNRPPMAKKLFNVCQCEQHPHLKHSILKSEAILRRRAASFARRNQSTISVCSQRKAKHSGDNLKCEYGSQLKPIKETSSQIELPLDRKSEASVRSYLKKSLDLFE